MLRQLPNSVRWSLLLTAAFVLINLITMYLIVVNQEMIGSAVIKQYGLASISPEQQTSIINYFIYGGAIVHIILSLLGIIFARYIVEGKRWARARLSGILIVSALISFYMFTHLLAGTSEILVHIFSDTIKLLIVTLLWVPVDSKKFFNK